MPRQLQLTQNLLDRAATAWNVVYSTVSFLINFPSHFEAFVKWIEFALQVLASKIGAYLLNSAARQADGAWKAARPLQRKGHGCRRHRKFVFKCADEDDAELLVGALRAVVACHRLGATVLRSRPRRRGCVRRDGVLARLDEELLVPAKPFGFLAAALNVRARAAGGAPRASGPTAEPARAGELPRRVAPARRRTVARNMGLSPADKL